MALSPDVVVVAPGELITAAHLNNIRANLVGLDTLKYDKTGGLLTGDVFIQKTSPGIYYRDPAGVALFSLQHSIGPPSGPVLATPAGQSLRHFIGAADRMTILPAGTVLWGDKLVSDIQQTGMEYATNGSLAISETTAGYNLVCVKAGVAMGSGQVFAMFQSGTVGIGSITVTPALNGVAYNTSSDKRIKTLTRPVDPDEALAAVDLLEPVHFTYNSNPEAGEQIGFFAQDVEAVAPEAVTAGSGEPDDPDFVPYMMDQSKLVPFLVAAVQSLTAKVADLQAQLAAL
jgi:hypothetical protein